MKFSSKKLCFVVASAAFVLVGCTKKPARPDPSITQLGMQPGGPNIDSTPRDALFDPNTPAIAARDPWMGGHNREVLQAQAVYFDFDKSDIKPSEREKLKVAKEYLDQNPSHKLLLEGHCDWRGTAEYNLGLGDRRASAAKRYLQSLGVPATRLETLSKGSLDASRNADEATMAQDRRVDVVVVDPSRGTHAAF